MVRKAVWISALASALALVTSANGVATVSKPTAISGPSPVLECAKAFDTGQTGRNYPNAEVEPQVSVSGDNIIMMERVDQIPREGGVHELPVMGVIELEGGKISAWREYFDMGQMRGS